MYLLRLCVKDVVEVFLGLMLPADVRLNRSLRRPYPQCAAGKRHAKAMPSSLTDPASSVGGVITFDLRVNAVHRSVGNMVGICL